MSDRQHKDVQPTWLLAAWLRDARAMFFVAAGLLATIAWIALLCWFVYRAVSTLGLG